MALWSPCLEDFWRTGSPDAGRADQFKPKTASALRPDWLETTLRVDVRNQNVMLKQTLRALFDAETQEDTMP